ncbi:conjugal transfer protein [Sphingomonas histidinilytica]|uniref:S26 family signal peptidase n=1 Tax=Rhizorhabdus histidinilytica TaxID=439228 RepID=UPI001ADA7DD5|nr:S26 family signal peptidase [Rhizorhabdus histidinilytica]MBO9378087.1 conjugal transfer protein [Rhizorhabdus histidinilytica]
MSRRPLSRFAPHIVGAAIGLTLVAAVLPLPKLLLWNASASAPIGLYRVNPIARPMVGDMVAVSPPPALARFMAERHYLPVGVPLLKHVAARPGALICRRDATVTIDGRTAAVARASDSRDRPLPVWRGCRVLRTDELFLLNAAPDSLDGRYFGPIRASGLIGRATPILTRDTPNAPLRWRSGCARSAPFTS